MKDKETMEWVVKNYQQLPRSFRKMGFISKPYITLEYLNSLDDKGEKQLDRLYEQINDHNNCLLEFYNDKPNPEVKDPVFKQLKNTKSNEINK